MMSIAVYGVIGIEAQESAAGMKFDQNEPVLGFTILTKSNFQYFR